MVKKTYISLGAGTQSTDLLLRGLRGEFSTIPEKAIFADTGCEPKAVYKYLEWLQEHTDKEYNFSIDVISAGNIYEDALSYAKKQLKSSDGIPYYTLDLETGKKAILKRQCTYDYKIAPVRRHIRKSLSKLEPINLWLGISFDEMERMKQANVKWITHQFPLIDRKLRRFDCINNFKQHGLPVPTRSSCIVCPYHSDDYWLWIYKNEPKSFESAVTLDEAIRNYPRIKGECYLHRSCKPLKEVIYDIIKASKLQSKQIKLFPELIEECDGICGI